MAQSKPKPIAEPQPPVNGGQDLQDADRDELTRYPSDVLVDESKPNYIGTENAPEAFRPQVSVVDSGLSGVTKEVHVVLDQVVPGEVYVPDEGRGELLLPIHTLVGAKTPQEQFDAADAVDPTPEDREQAAAEGRSASEVASARKSE
jgi:hypothetical protein